MAYYHINFKDILECIIFLRANLNIKIVSLTSFPDGHHHLTYTKD